MHAVSFNFFPVLVLLQALDIFQSGCVLTGRISKKPLWAWHGDCTLGFLLLPLHLIFASTSLFSCKCLPVQNLLRVSNKVKSTCLLMEIQATNRITSCDTPCCRICRHSSTSVFTVLTTVCCLSALWIGCVQSCLNVEIKCNFILHYYHFM